MNQLHAVSPGPEPISDKRIKALEDTDHLPPGLRECVHEFGLPIVSTCVKFGIRTPVRIRELVREVWNGARQTGQSGDAYDTLDWLLMQSGAGVSSKTLCRFLADRSLTITSVEPTKAMLAASMAEVSGFDIRCSKEEKHRRRLRAALRSTLPTILKSGVTISNVDSQK